MRSFRDISDIRFTPDRLGEVKIHSKLPGLKELRNKNEIHEYFKLSIGADSIKVTSELFPREHKVFREVLSMLGLNANDHELYMSGENQRNAFILSTQNHSQMVLSTELSSILDEDELRFVIGHEFGHFICDHSSIPTNIITSHDEIDMDFKLDVLKWSRCAEITADRYGVLCCGKLEASLSALFKVSFGIKPTSLSSLRSSMKNQYKMLVELSKGGGNKQDILSSRTHPIIPLRCVAIEITFMDIQSFKLQSSWNKSSIEYIDKELMQVINNLI